MVQWPVQWTVCAAARRMAERSDWKRMKARISAWCCFRERRRLSQDLSIDMRITPANDPASR